MVIKMFKHIAVAYITPTKKTEAFYHALSLAENYDSKLTLMEFFLHESPKFFFFETKKEKETGKVKRTEIKEQLKKLKEKAEKKDISVTIHIESSESIVDSILNYLTANKVDLLIVDHPHVPHLSESHYEDIVNTIHHEIKCDMLTLK